MTEVRNSVQVYKAYFSNMSARFGRTIKALDYGGPESQRRKFEILRQGIRPTKTPLSFLDVGCGFGDFYDYLKRHRIPISHYAGVDLVPETVRVARKRYPEGDFQVRDILQNPSGIRYDYGIANGIFYLRAADSERYLRRMVMAIWENCKKGVLFNARSRYADSEFVKREKHLFQYDPNEVLEFCLGLTRAVALRQDYAPHEFTMYLYRAIQR